MSILKSWYESGKHTDVNLVFKASQQSSNMRGKMILRNNDSVVIFSAHKLILGARSPVFERLFYSPENKEKLQDFSLEDDPVEFKHFLNFLYGELPIQDSLLAIFKCANKYQVGIKLSCSKKKGSEKHMKRISICT